MADLPQDPELRQRKSVGTLEINEHGDRRVVSLDELNQADAELAAKFGYNPVFKREFGYLSAFSFAVSISGLFATVSTTFIYPLSAGGSASAVWSWAISGAGCMCLALSVAEIVSAYPTSGGLYYSVSRLVPKDSVPWISWVTGWLNLLGQVAGLASSEYGAAQLLLAAVSMGSDFTYVATTGTVIGVMAALTTVTGIINSLSTYWIERITRSYFIIHVAVLVSCSIALLARAKDRHSATYVFTNVESVSGWSPVGFSFLFGFLSVSWTMTAYDATAHITEEMREPELKAPWAISLAMAFTYIGGFLFNIVLCFVMGEPAEILKSPMAQPVAQIFFNVLGKAGGIFFTVCAVIVLKFLCIAGMQSLARTVFAFSRDRLIPGSRIWTKINPLTQTPVYAVWISVVLCIVINLIGLGSYIAIAGVFNVTAIAIDWSYVIPILCKLICGQFEPGPWHLGKASFWVNLWACIWTIFVTIIFILPTMRPVTALNMNYAIAFLGLIFALAAIYWVISGRKFYTGPVVEADLVESSFEGVRDGSSEENSRKESKSHVTLGK